MHPRNLKDIDFKERATVENMIDELMRAAKDPYSASLPLMASAELGDSTRYALARTAMLKVLKTLNKNPETYEEWMRSNSFKAWMWGRVLSAATSMTDIKMLMKSKYQLSLLFNEKMTKDDSLAFYTWAKAYNAALNIKNYRKFKNQIIKETEILSKISQENPTDHDALSNALWAWVMDLSAAANARDQKNYLFIKEQIKSLTQKTSVTQALETGLLRTADSNDYPAWAMAKVRLAASMMNDSVLENEIAGVLEASIDAANRAGAKAEYSLAVIENQL